MIATGQPVSSPLRIAAALVALFHGAVCSAQPTPPPQPVPIDPAMVLTDARSAYTRAISADEVWITLRDEHDRAESERLVIRIEPGASGDPGPRSMLIEMSSLRLYLRPGRLVAIPAAPRDQNTCWVTEFQGPITPSTLRALAPSVPLPEIALACPSSRDDELAYPFTQGVRWTAAAASQPAPGKPSHAAATGLSDLGKVALEIAVATGRLRSFSLEVDPDAALPSGAVIKRVEMQFTPVDPGDPAAWAITDEGRRPVDSLADLLRRAPSAAGLPTLSRGDAVPDLTLQDREAGVWSLHDAARNAGGFTDQGPVAAPVVVLLFRSTLGRDAAADAGAEADAVAGREAVRIALASPPADAPPDGVPRAAAPRRFADKAAAIVEPADADRDRYIELGDRWLRAPRGTDGHPAPAFLLDSDQLSWSSAVPDALARFSRDAKAILAVVGEDLTVKAVIVLDGRAGQIDAIAAELLAALATKPPVER